MSGLLRGLAWAAGLTTAAVAAAVVIGGSSKSSGAVALGDLSALIQKGDGGWYVVVPIQAGMTGEITQGPYSSKPKATAEALEILRGITPPIDLPIGALAQRENYRGRTLSVIRTDTNGPFELRIAGDGFGGVSFTGFDTPDQALAWGRNKVDERSP